MALRVNKFDTLAPDYKNKVNDYIEAKMPLHLQEVLIALRDKAHWQIRKVVEFITAYGEENANKNEIEELDSKLSDLDEKIASHQDLADAVDAINQIIDRLVDQTMASSKMHTLKYSTDKCGIEYSVLSSYIYPYLAQMSFAEIPAGKFTMGSPNSEKNRYRDEKQVRVEISHGFEIGLTEVTQYQWFVVMGSNPSYIKDKKYCPQSFMVLGGISLCSDFPVEDVSWNDIEYYIREYNKRVKDGYTYRLPTEAEWEYAARAGTSTAFSFGDNPSMLKDYAWYIINSEMQTHNVASKKPNAWGLYDVHGNVWEWVSDNYHYTESYRLKDTVGLSRNPVGPSRGSTRVMRGGSSHNNWYNLRSASINYWGPGKSNYNIGFRLVRTK